MFLLPSQLYFICLLCLFLPESIIPQRIGWQWQGFCCSLLPFLCLACIRGRSLCLPPPEKHTPMQKQRLPPISQFLWQPSAEQVTRPPFGSLFWTGSLEDLQVTLAWGDGFGHFRKGVFFFGLFQKGCLKKGRCFCGQKSPEK